MPRGVYDRTKSKPRSKRIPPRDVPFLENIEAAEELQKLILKYGSEGAKQLIRSLGKRKVKFTFH